VSYREESLPYERLLLAVVADDTSRLLCQASLPLAAVAPGLHYHLKLLLPAPGGAPQPALFVTLCLQPAPRTQLHHLWRAPLVAAAAAGPTAGARLLQARLAGTSAPLARGGGRQAGAELWAVWRPHRGASAAGPAAAAQGVEDIDITAIHTPVDASDPAAIELALHRATAALLGSPSSSATPGSPPAPTYTTPVCNLLLPAAAAAQPPALPPFQALPLQRLGGGNGSSGAESLLWPPDHTALLPLQGPGLSSGGSASGSQAGAILELHVLEYGERPSSSSGNAAAAPGAGRAAAALLRARGAHATRSAVGGGGGGPLQPPGGRALASHVVARLELGGGLLPEDRTGERLVLEGLPLVAPDGSYTGTATIEAVPWDARAFLGHLQGLAGSDGSSAKAPQPGPAAFCGPGELPPGLGGGLPQAVVGACVRSGAALLVETLARDMVGKQAALERLQRVADAAGAHVEAAGARLRDAQNRNRWGTSGWGGAGLAPFSGC
jgi:hypothetical protein